MAILTARDVHEGPGGVSLLEVGGDVLPAVVPLLRRDAAPRALHRRAGREAAEVPQLESKGEYRLMPNFHLA